jgi:hypothetical protein
MKIEKNKGKIRIYIERKRNKWLVMQMMQYYIITHNGW